MNLITQVINLFEIGSWTTEYDYFDDLHESPKWQRSDIHPHFESRGDKLHENAPLTAHFQNHSVPVSLFEPKEDSIELRLSPLGENHFFQPGSYDSSEQYRDALQFLFSPIPADLHYALNIDLRSNPALIGFCYTVALRLAEHMKKRKDAEVAAELRTKDDKQSCVLVKFREASFFIFDRCAGYYAIPRELLLGWYAPLFTGQNQHRLPSFDKYKEMYEAYSPANLVLNSSNLHIRGN